MKKNVTILYSGGLDSFIMVKLAQHKFPDLNLNLVHFNIGQDYSTKEFNAIKNSQFNVDIRNVDWMTNNTAISKNGNNGGNIFIPGRNLVLASLAASIYMPDEVWMGGLKGEDHSGATDKNQTFIDKTNDTWAYVYSPYNPVPKLVFPLIDQNWGKFEAVEWLYTSGLATKEEITQTSSCLSGEDGNCGHCMVCCRRKFIFKQLGFEEVYNQDPLTSKSNILMILEMLNDFENITGKVHYDKWRQREIIPGLYLEFNTTNHNNIKHILSQKLEALV